MSNQTNGADAVADLESTGKRRSTCTGQARGSGALQEPQASNSQSSAVGRYQGSSVTLGKHNRQRSTVSNAVSQNTDLLLATKHNKKAAMYLDATSRPPRGHPGVSQCEPADRKVDSVFSARLVVIAAGTGMERKPSPEVSCLYLAALLLYFSTRD